MTLARLSLLLAFLALTTCAMADEGQSSSQTNSSNADMESQSSSDRRGGGDTLPRNPDVAPRPRLLFPGAEPRLAVAPDTQDRGLSAHFRTRHGVSLAPGW